MLKIGLTGGIGSGKSTISKVFNALGVPVYNADERSKNLLNQSDELINSVKLMFGHDAYNAGTLNREYIASIIFSNPFRLNDMNQLVHPFVLKDFLEWSKLFNSKPYVLMEAAILFESGANKALDAAILVVSPEKIRIQRVVERDRITPEMVMDRIKNQWPADKLLPLADFIIENDDKQLILPQILTIDKNIKQKWQNLANGLAQD